MASWKKSNNIPSNFGQKSSNHILKMPLTDSCAFTILCVVASALKELFPYEWDQKFNEKCLSQLWKHLQTNVKGKVNISVLLSCLNYADINNYIDVLLKDSEMSGKQCLLIQLLLLFAVKEGKYDARMRVLIQHLALLIKVPIEIVDFYEDSVIDCLQSSSKITNDDPKEIRKKRKDKIKQYALIGLTSVCGGAILGVTGGLAAPLLVAGVETLLGAGSIALLSSSLGGTIIGSLFGVAGAGLAGHKMKKRMGNIEEFKFVLFTGNSDDYSSLNITIAISGWLSDEQPDNFTKPWKRLMNSREQYYLRYESKYLLKCGRAMSQVFNSAGARMAAQELLKHTIVEGIIAAISWPASLLTLASFIDNPWAVCCKRTEEVGKKLADVLMQKLQGERPVTLIGYSLGARVIFYCLLAMSERAGCEGIVQNAVLLGTPVTRSVKLWNKLSRVVSGKIINGYSKKDWFLMFAHRAVSMAFGEVAGTQPVNSSDKKIVNVDLTHLVFGHVDYSTKIDEILKLINIRTLDKVPMCL